MRTYIVSYEAERRDESTDCEKPIEAETLRAALDAFEATGIVHKRITGLQEQPIKN